MRLYNNKNKKSYVAMEVVAINALIGEVANLLPCAISAVVTNTILVWVDLMNSIGETLHCLIVVLVSRKMRKETGDMYNFGLDRLEVFTSFICDALVLGGLIGILASAIYSIFHPQAPPESLKWFIILKCINSTIDAIYLIGALRVKKKHESRMVDSEVRNYVKMLTHDVVVGVIITASYFLRDYSWSCYMSPIASILIILYFGSTYIKKIKESMGELSDISIPIQDQDEIFDMVLDRPEIIKRIDAVNCHTLNKKLYVDICLQMHDNITYQQQLAFLDELDADIKQKIENSDVRLVINQPEAEQ